MGIVSCGSVRYANTSDPLACMGPFSAEETSGTKTLLWICKRELPEEFPPETYAIKRYVMRLTRDLVHHNTLERYIQRVDLDPQSRAMLKVKTQEVAKTLRDFFAKKSVKLSHYTIWEASETDDSTALFIIDLYFELGEQP